MSTAVSNLVDSAPGTLDTLNELAAALGDDANFSTTVTDSIATKLPLAGGTMTGVIAGFESTGIDDNASSTAVTIDSSENVGIGTAAPALNLHVHSSADTALLLTNTTSGSDADSGLEIKVINSGAHAYINQQEAADLIFRTNDTDRMRINSSGEVGINTTSGGAKLRVSKGASTSAGIFEGSGYQTYFGYGGNDDNYISSGTSGSNIFRSGSTERMRITSAGNVGYWYNYASTSP